ncbi:Hpt domain-containing protein [uncultured Thiohalocapsa sp.]|uniref:Hpt domain-containing protein n=1 Tax=uncultured Thiohalocapsa sp. TaxID=768990 RepID=UPI0025F2B071|nr:Hpt domain-containing protein [uncultured Thiohalocapsa sp.]
MVRTFLAEYPAAIAAIGAALDADDRAAVHDLLHRLRGAAGALGAAELAAAAGRLERALAGDGPVDADLRARFCASSAAPPDASARISSGSVDSLTTRQSSRP